MNYKLMRARKYYDVLRTDRPFFQTHFSQKIKIITNIIKFFIYNSRKSLIIKNKPVTAQIEPTSQCNLKCPMCIRQKTGMPIGSMSLENFKKIIDKLNGLFKIHLSGQGEPFLNPDIFKMIEYANKKGIQIRINTNGTLLNKEIIKKICGGDIGEISVSIDSTKKELYEKIRRGANFEKTLKNVKELVSELKKNKKKTIVTTVSIILKDNITEIPEFVNLASKLGINKIIFQTLQEKKDYIENYSKEIKNQGVSELSRKVRDKIAEAKTKDIKIIFDEQKSPGCMWPWRGIYVTWDGYVTACCKILDYKRPRMGNLLEEDFWEIWNGKNYQMFRQLLRERKAPLPCIGCSMV